MKWSRSKLLNRIYWIIAIIGILVILFAKSEVVKTFAYIGVLGIGLLGTCMDTIKKQKNEVIKNNNLRHIILSDCDTIFFTIYFIIVIPLFNIFGKNIKGFVASFIVVISVLLILQKVSKEISNHFKSKLIIPKEEE